MLRIEAMARASADLVDLRHLMVNETRKLTRARQIFVVELSRGRPVVSAVTGVGVVDPRSLLADSVAGMIGTIEREHGLDPLREITLPAFCDPASELASAYPFRELLWLSLTDRSGQAFAGLLLAREMPWGRDEIAIARRLADTYAHAWGEVTGAPRLRSRAALPRAWRWLAALATAALLMVPVPMTALAPVEIVAAQPFIVAAPLDGVIETIEIDPSAPVKEGDVLVRFTDTTLRNRLEVAAREVAVADARVKQATLMAFNEQKGRHELGIAQAELELKRAEQAFAADLLARAHVRAPRTGIAIYPDRRLLIGKPVATGERIMEIADPAAVEARIDLAVPDAIALKPDSDVKLFLDIDPLRARAGRVIRSDYRARPNDNDVLAFRTVARLEHDDRPLPRIGLRGTAQITGDPAPLGLLLLRRPLSALRQWLGL